MMNKFNNDEHQKQDKRNLIVFMLAVFALFALYDVFIKQPYVDTLKDQQKSAESVAVEQQKEAETRIPQSRDDIVANSSRIKIESPHFHGSIALKGARIDDVVLKDYFETLEKKENVTLLAPSGTTHPYYGQFGWLANNIKTPDAKTVWQVQGNRTLTPENPVMLVWNNGQGLVFKQKISLDDQFMFSIEQSVDNRSGQDITLYPYGLVAQNGKPADLQKAFILHEGPIGYIGSELEEVNYKDIGKKKRIEKTSDQGWIGFTEKYWFAGIVPVQGEETKFRFTANAGVDKTLYQTDVMGAQRVVAAGESASVTSHFFAGPKKVRLLDRYEHQLNVPHFDLVVDFGMFYFLTKPFFYALTWISQGVGSFALGLILFTVCLRLLVFPLAQKSYKSFAKMRTIAPKMKELQEQYKDDRQGMQKALFDLYKKEDVNPAAGCLPLLVQIPIFFALYKVLFVTLEMRHTPFWGWINDMSAPDPTTIFNLFGLIPWDPPSFLMIGAWPCIMLVTLLIQQRLSPPPTEEFQKTIMTFMPFVMTIVLSRFPAGLVIYWTWSNMLSIIQQTVLMKSMGVEIHLFSFMKSKKEKEIDDILEHAPQALESIEHEVEEVLDEEDEQTPPKPITPPKRRRKKK